MTMGSTVRALNLVNAGGTVRARLEVEHDTVSPIQFKLPRKLAIGLQEDLKKLIQSLVFLGKVMRRSRSNFS